VLHANFDAQQPICRCGVLVRVAVPFTEQQRTAPRFWHLVDTSTLLLSVACLPACFALR
jgi:hypothetical protein